MDGSLGGWVWWGEVKGTFRCFNQYPNTSLASLLSEFIRIVIQDNPDQSTLHQISITPFKILKSGLLSEFNWMKTCIILIQVHPDQKLKMIVANFYSADPAGAPQANILVTFAKLINGKLILDNGLFRAIHDSGRLTIANTAGVL